MRRYKVAIIGVAWVAIILAGSFNRSEAAELTAKVSDTSGNMVSLTRVTTAQLAFHIGEADRSIPVVQIRQIDGLERGGLLKITLVSGEVMEGTSTAVLTGEWELGAYTLDINKAKSIAFGASQGTPEQIPPWKSPAGFVADINGTTVYDLRYEFSYTGRSSLWIPPKIYTSQMTYLWLPFVKGSALYYVPFSRIQSTTPDEITLTDGTKMNGSLFNTQEREQVFQGRDRKVKGQTPFGEIEFPISNIKKITFLYDKDAQVATVEDQYKQEHGKFKSKSKLSGVITTTDNIPVPVTQLEVLTVDSEGYSFAKESVLSVFIGDARNAIDLAKLKAVSGIKVGGEAHKPVIRADVVTKSGNTLATTFERSDVFFGGTCDQGYVVVGIEAIKSVDIK